MMDWKYIQWRGDEWVDDTAEWPDDRKDAYWRAIQQFNDGDLGALREYLEQGGVVARDMALHLCAALGDYGPVKFSIHRNTRDRRPISEHEAKYFRDLEIGIRVEKSLRSE